MINVYLFFLIAIFIYMTFWFLFSVLKNRNDVADIAWGLGFPLISWLAFLISGFSPVSFVVNILITIWGGRLAYHIYQRLKNNPEDFRYVAMRNKWRFFYFRSFFQIFILQGILMFFIVLPALFINVKAPSGFGWLPHIGVLVWLLGFYFEARGDWQLSQFIKKPENAGKILTDGLWKFTRHPNYFGEVLMWWGIFISALSIYGGFLTVLGPILITCLILFVSGIPMVEKRYAGRSDFEEYKKRTSVFFPLPQKKI